MTDGKRVRATLIAALLAALGCCVAACGGNEDASGYVKIACHDWVKDRLKSPGPAEFSEDSVSKVNEQRYILTGAVDSQNGFGAMIRNTYRCEASHVGGSTRLVSLTGLTE